MKGEKSKAVAVTAAVLERDLEAVKGENKKLLKAVAELRKERDKVKKDQALEFEVRQDLRDKLEATQKQLKEVTTKLEKAETELLNSKTRVTFLESVNQTLGHGLHGAPGNSLR